MSTIKADNLNDTDSTNNAISWNFVDAWIEFDSVNTTILNDGGVSTMVDTGTGAPVFTSENSRTSYHAACWTLHAIYSTSVEYAHQKGGRSLTTSSWESYCCSNTNTRNDWLKGYSGVIGR